MNKRAIVFAPHPDDETFGCGGTIAKKVSEGFEVLVVIMTDGRFAFSKVFGIDEDPTPEELKEIRKAEVRSAMRILGLSEKNLLFLDFKDRKLAENGEKAEKEVIKILYDHRPSEVYYTYKKDFHPDHRAANHIVDNAIMNSHLHLMKYQYSISLRFGRIGMWLENLLHLLRHDRYHADVKNFLHLKEAAIKEFRSEISIISKKQQNPLIKNYQRFLRAKEMFFIGTCIH